ncbi:MAG: anti-sigma factor family protein [Planctomycetota bacterium]|jgi:hypothetical protein
MDCKALEEQLSEYMDGRLSEGERREIAAHLDACPDCREALEQLQKVVDLVGELPYVTAPEGLHEKILRQNLKVVPGEDKPFALPPRYSRWLPLMRGVAAAAVLMLFAFLGHELIDTGPVAPESAAPATEVSTADPDAAPGKDEDLKSKDLESLEDGVSGEAFGKTARGKLLKEGKGAGSKKPAEKPLRDQLGKPKPPTTRAGRKYRERAAGEAREPAPAKDEKGKWEDEEAEAGAADRRKPARDREDPAAPRSPEKGRIAGKPAAPDEPRQDQAPSEETKKKGEAPAEKAVEKESAPAARGRGERAEGDAGEGLKMKKKRADAASGRPAPLARRGLRKQKEIPVTLLVFTADPAKALAGIESEVSKLMGRKKQKEAGFGGALDEAAKKLEGQDKGGARQEERKREGAPPPGSGGGAPGTEDAPHAGEPAPTPSPGAEDEEASGAKKESKSHDRRKDDAESDDFEEDADAAGKAGPEGGAAKAEGEKEKKEKLEEIQKGLAVIKEVAVVKVLRLTFSEYKALKKKMADREETSQFREDPTNLYMALLKKLSRLRAQAKAGFTAGASGKEEALIQVTVRFKAPPAPKAKKAGAKTPAPTPRPAAEPGATEKEEEKEEKKKE